jgi:hypothetical protein
MSRRSDELRKRLAEQFERAAHVFEVSAELAELHADAQRRLGRPADEAQEHRRAQFAQNAAQRARENALALAEPRPPREPTT